jgi:creatinine amidohydrolase
MASAQDKKVFWAEMLRHEVEDAARNRGVVIVPTGSIEQHGPHCPMDVDVSIPHHLAVQAAQTIDEFPVIVAPAVHYGLAHYNLGYPGTITLSLETYVNVVSDVSRSIYRNGLERIVLLNGHGGNHHILRSIAIKLAQEDVYILPFSHWELVEKELEEWSETDAGSIGHGGEWETSLQLYLRPHLVDRSRQVSHFPMLSVAPAFERFATFAERQRETPSGVMGDPRAASAEKGERYVRAAVPRLVQLIRAYRAQDVRHYRHWREGERDGRL